ncbi:hypothetical protein PFICI_14111 [Pestalotiopsis fici W106-1]|uniref:Uncharacterized protein n=1 Tax=Pestalotiopsis fici (strain W106-1 / CGMCC3.15140) TaxID=1229662 RepID=W3WK18_PESFW|nr:uncharacterized protein PFICI_14111 [Pestalotiopsis fici W106-1]ETS74245.1 hypothetical protein PFICI_14111 [Pestalotiopsis fici W106-1]
MTATSVGTATTETVPTSSAPQTLAPSSRMSTATTTRSNLMEERAPTRRIRRTSEEIPMQTFSGKGRRQPDLVDDDPTTPLTAYNLCHSRPRLSPLKGEPGPRALVIFEAGLLGAPVDHHGYLADANVAYGYEEYQQQDGPPEMPNKGYVFVTYGDARESDAAIQRPGGVMHMDRMLVCRPGLPKGVAFRQDDLNGGAFRSHRSRRFERFDSMLEEA